MPPGCSKLRANPLRTRPGQVVITMGMFGLAARTRSAEGSADATMKSSGIAASSFAIGGPSESARWMRFSTTTFSPSTNPCLLSSEKKSIEMFRKIAGQQADARHARHWIRVGAARQQRRGAQSQCELLDEPAALVHRRHHTAGSAALKTAPSAAEDRAVRRCSCLCGCVRPALRPRCRCADRAWFPSRTSSCAAPMPRIPPPPRFAAFTMTMPSQTISAMPPATASTFTAVVMSSFIS